MSEDNPQSPDEFSDFSEDLTRLTEGIKNGKEPTLADLLLYQRVLNYNTVVMYKNMVVIMKAIKGIQDQLEDIEKGQEDVFLQVQEFLDAHKLIKDIDEPKEPT